MGTALMLRLRWFFLVLRLAFCWIPSPLVRRVPLRMVLLPTPTFLFRARTEFSWPSLSVILLPPTLMTTLEPLVPTRCRLPSGTVLRLPPRLPTLCTTRGSGRPLTFLTTRPAPSSLAGAALLLLLLLPALLVTLADLLLLLAAPLPPLLLPLLLPSPSALLSLPLPLPFSDPFALL